MINSAIPENARHCEERFLRRSNPGKSLVSISLSQAKYLSLALFLHILLFIAIGLYFEYSQPTIQSGNTISPEVSSYLYQDAIHAEKKSVVTPVEKGLKTIVPQQAERIGGSMKGAQTDELLALLHNEIQQHQRYPIGAQQLEREGRVTVSFNLNPNGNIQQLQMVKSSGTESLDRAALSAVRDAVPFKGVSALLESVKSFSVDVVFEL